MTSFRVQHQCPQCGAAIEFAETDHLLICPFCDVRNFMWTPHYLRFVFHPQVTDGPADRVVYAPYLHFKGNVFFTRGPKLERKVLEFTSLGLASKATAITRTSTPNAATLTAVAMKAVIVVGEPS